MSAGNTNYQLSANYVPTILNQSLEDAGQNSVETINEIVHSMTGFSPLHPGSDKPAVSFDSRTYSEVEARDKPLIVPIPRKKASLTISIGDLEIYLTQLCRMVWSRAFHFYSTNQLGYEYCKIYCSEQILQNIMRLSNVFHLSQYHFEAINKHLRNKLLDYMLLKYPITMSPAIYRNLNNVAKEVDYTHMMKAQYLGSLGIVFKYRQNGQYNDLIMRVINEVINKIQKKVGNQTVYQKFQRKFQELFQKVKDVDWINDNFVSNQEKDMSTSILDFAFNLMQKEKEKVKQKVSQHQKQKYAQKVQSYTHYLIGRKMPESTKLFSQKDIDSQNLTFQSTQMLRVITKWCEQLQKKFNTPNYYESHVDYLGFDQGQGQILLTNRMKQILDDLMRQQSIKINQQIYDLRKNNFYMQSRILQRQKKSQAYTQYSPLQQSSAHFTIDMVQNLHSYLVIYLNRLIHGLLTVSTRFTKTLQQNNVEFSGVIRLITFQIMDLIRCKCASGQREIICLFNQIKRMCSTGSLQLIRVVNRLKRGTNDIMVNIKYRQVICEIQLAVTSKQSKFIQYSNSFNHYLYQLKRAMFGPLTEICSIWKSIDAKFNIYQKMQPPIFYNQQKSQCSHAQFKTQTLPFICNLCNQHYYHNTFIKNHIKCRQCNFWMCARCQLSDKDCKNLLSSAFRNQQLVKQTSRISKDSPLAQYGICCLVERREVLLEPFRIFQDRNQYYVMGIKNKRPYLIRQYKDKKQLQKFKYQYIVFDLGKLGSKYIKLEDNKIRQFFISQKLKSIYRKNKLQICLNEGNFTTQQLSKICELGSYEEKYVIRQVQLVDNCLQKISVIANQFRQIDTLEASRNNIKDFQGLQKLQNLQRLSLNSNKIVQFPKQIVQLSSLLFLSLCENQLENVEPNIAKLTKLKYLKLSNNKFKQIPEQCFGLKTINQIDFKNNLIVVIPKTIQNWKDLTKLQLENNQINSIDENIGKLLKLVTLNISHNKLTKLPQSLNNLKGLSKLYLRNNQIVQLSPEITKLSSLNEFDVSNNQLKTFPPITDLPKLVNLNISNNKLTQMPVFGQCCQTLRFLCLSNNQICLNNNKNTKNTCLNNLVGLIQMYLTNNSLTQITQTYLQMKKLQILHLEGNKLVELKQLRFQRLKSLYCQRNQLKDCSKLQMRSLQQLVLNHNQLTVFSNNQLPQLRRFIASNNKLNQVQILSCGKLQHVELNNNNLKEIPLINPQSNLKRLQLQSNSIKVIPDYLIQHKSLKHLNISMNQITYIPEALSQLINIEDKNLIVFGNPIKVVGCMKYLDSRVSNESAVEKKKWTQLQQSLEKSVEEQKNQDMKLSSILKIVTRGGSDNPGNPESSTNIGIPTLATNLSNSTGQQNQTKQTVQTNTSVPSVSSVPSVPGLPEVPGVQNLLNKKP